jgi:tetratricopeptide (TPR) repeat protein
LAAAYLYALAAHGAGRKELALAQLGRAEALYHDVCKAQLATERNILPEPFSNWCWDLGTAQVLRREAWQKLKGQAPPPDPWWHLAQGRSYGLIGESQRAEKEFAAAVAAAPDDPIPLVRRAAWYARCGQREKAEAALVQAASLKPGLGSTLDLADGEFDLGQAYWKTGRRAEAHRVWQKCLGRLHRIALERPEDQALQQRIVSREREIGLRYAAMGLWDLAATVARHNAELKRMTVYYSDADFAVLLAATGEEEMWRRYCQGQVSRLREDLSGKPPGTHIVRTSCLFEPPAVDAAECVGLASGFLASEEFAKMAPGTRCFPEFCLGLALLRASRHREASRILQTNPTLYSGFVYAMAVQGAGRKDEALAPLERAERRYRGVCKTALAPNREDLPAEHARYPWDLAAAQLLRRETWGKIQGKAPPVDPWWHLIQARGFGLIGETERAEKEFAAAVAAAPNDPEVWTTRARLFEQFGQAARAEADQKKAQELGAGKEAGGVRGKAESGKPKAASGAPKVESGGPKGK